MISTIREFVKRCDSLKNISDAYDVFEDECTDELRDLIYNTLSMNDDNEPFRAAMYNLGYHDF